MGRPERMLSFRAYAIYQVYYTTDVYENSSIHTRINDYSYQLLFDYTKCVYH